MRVLLPACIPKPKVWIFIPTLAVWRSTPTKGFGTRCNTWHGKAVQTQQNIYSRLVKCVQLLRTVDLHVRHIFCREADVEEIVLVVLRHDMCLL